MKILNADFETRSEKEVNDIGAYMYSIHPSTDILRLAYDLNDGKGVRLWRRILPNGKRIKPPQDLLDFISDGDFILSAHNAGFEYCIWNNILVPRLGFPPVKIEQLDCSAAQAAALALPRALDNLGKAIDAPIKKDSAGKTTMIKMSKPRKATKDDSSKWHEKEEDFKILDAYNMTDVLAEKSVREIMPPLPSASKKLYHFTEKINERGIYCDIELCKIAVSFAERFQAEVLKNLKPLTNGKVETAKQNKRILEFLAGEGLELENLQALTVTTTLKRSDISPKARKLLEIRQALGKSSLSKYGTMLETAGPDNRIRGTLLFHGASTGRYSGRLIQPQNFPRGVYKDVETIFAALRFNDYGFFKCLYPDVFGALSSALRGMLCAPKGKTLMAADFASIEVRVLFWIAECEHGLQMYRDKTDLYVFQAMQVYGIKSPSLITKDQRFLGKEIVLGSGFGLGWKRFMVSCEQKGVKVEAPLAKLAINSYRETFPEVPLFWKNLESACIRACRTGRLQRVGRLQILTKDGFLWIRLPSGRKLAYYKPQVKLEETKFGPKPTLSFMAVHSKTRQWVRETTWGGKMTENVVQGIAADVMTEAMLREENAGSPIVMTIHDELIAEVDLDKADLRKFEEIMSMVPAWAEGLPVAVEGWVNKRFRK